MPFFSRHRLRTAGLVVIFVLLAVLVTLLTRDRDMQLQGALIPGHTTVNRVGGMQFLLSWENFPGADPGILYDIFRDLKDPDGGAGSRFWEHIGFAGKSSPALVYNAKDVDVDNTIRFKVCEMKAAPQVYDCLSQTMGFRVFRSLVKPKILKKEIIYDANEGKIKLTVQPYIYLHDPVRNLYAGNTIELLRRKVDERCTQTGLCPSPWENSSEFETEIIYTSKTSTAAIIDLHPDQKQWYEYKVYAVIASETSLESDSVFIHSPQYAPFKPQSCSATALDATTIRIDAEPQDRFTGPQAYLLNKYGQASRLLVYRSTAGFDSGMEFIGRIDLETDLGKEFTKSPLIDTERTAGVTYYYAITAQNSIDDYQIRSPDSPDDERTSLQQCFTTVKIPSAPPPRPLGLRVEADPVYLNATLNWLFVDGVPWAVPVTFSVWHALQEAGPYEKIAAAAFTDRSIVVPLRDGVINYFQVKADDGIYESDASNTVSITVPPAPPVLDADPVVRTMPLSPTEVRLSWRAGSTDDRRMRIQKSLTGNADSFTDIHTTASSAEYSFVDAGLEQDTEYFYRIFAFNATGESPPSATVAVRPLPGHIFPPSFLRIAPLSGARLQLDWWDINTAENGYKIEYSTSGADGVFKAFATVNRNIETFTTSELLTRMQYTFRIRAFNRSGLSDSSDAVSVLLPDRAPPAPFALEGQFAGHANLRWQISEAAYVTSFSIERSESETDGFAEIRTVPLDPQCKYSTQGAPDQACGLWNSPMLSPGDDFYFRIRARNSAGDSEPSNTVRVIGPVPIPPATPANLTATFVRGNTGGFLLTWTDAADNEELFEIEHKIDAISPDWSPFFSVPADTVEFLDTSFSSLPFQYRIRASNRGGFSAWSNEVTVIRPPQAPENLTGFAQTNGITLAWEDSSDNESNFVIQRAIAPRDEFDFAFVHQTGSDTTTFTDTSIQSGETYHYRVLARNAGGDSLPSNILLLTAFPAPPAAPSDLTVSTVVGSATILQLRWTDNATNETGFEVERSLTGLDDSWTAIATKPADNTLYNDFNLTPNTPYFYRVYAFNAGGRSDPTQPKSIVTPMTSPNAPTAVTAEVLSSARVVLRWTDRSNDEGAFEVERAMNAAGPWAALSTTLENSTMFTDTNVQAETQYFYRVRAVKLSAASPFTPAISATTHTFIGAPNNLFATVVSSNQIDLRWADRSDNETGFSIERRNEQAPDPTWTRIATVGANVTTFQNTGLSASTRYLYRLRAMLGTSMFSDYSNDAPETTFPCLLNGSKEATEFCDDGNSDPGDGCSPHCVIEEDWSCTRVNGERSACQRCGNSTIEGNETCDDGNTADGDGCGGYACWKENGWTCTGEPSVCLRCGNGIIEESETCEDGNTDTTDGCDQCHKTAGWTCTGNPSICQKCGNGILEGNEKNTGRCDDGDTMSGDGCSATCTVETGWVCYGWTESICKNCDNGIVEGNETCDDQNTNPNDGCSNSCLIEPRWTCTGTPSACYRCGDGTVDPGQECDQQANQTLNGDGCSSTCLLEPGWSCTTGNNSLCAQTCGDGFKNGADACDDGDLENGDGCGASCRVEAGWTCTGSPSNCQSALALLVRQLMNIGPTDVPTLRQRLTFYSAALRAEQTQNLQFDANKNGIVNRLDTRQFLTVLRQLTNR